MKKYRSVIIFAIVVLIFAGAAFYFTKYYTPKTKKTSTDKTSSTTETVSVLKYGDKLSKFSITVDNTQYDFEKVKTEWKIIKPKDFKFDVDKINSLASSLTDLTADKVIGDNVKNLSDYGLDKPITITVKSKDGKEEIIELGKETPVKSGYYLKLKDHGKVYVVSTTVGESLKLDKSALMAKDLFPKKVEDYKTLSLYKNGELTFKTKYISTNKWAVEEPIQMDADDQVISPIIEGLPNIKIQSYEKKANDSEYGLDNPSYTLIYGTKTGETKIIFGNEKVKGTSIYAKVDGKDDVFSLNLDTLNFLDKSLYDVTSKIIAIPDYKDVSEMAVTSNGKTHTSKITVNKDNKEKDQFVVDGVDLKKKKKDDGDKLFREYYQAIIGLRFDKISKDEQPEGDPTIKVVYTLKKDPGKIEVSLISKDDKYYYAMKNGKYTGALVAKSLVEDELLKQTQNLEKFIDKVK